MFNMQPVNTNNPTVLPLHVPSRPGCPAPRPRSARHRSRHLLSGYSRHSRPCRPAQPGRDQGRRGKRSSLAEQCRNPNPRHHRPGPACSPQSPSNGLAWINLVSACTCPVNAPSARSSRARPRTLGLGSDPLGYGRIGRTTQMPQAPTVPVLAM